jgi:hypothetical protein
MRLWLRDISVTFEGDGGTLTIAPDGRGQMLRVQFSVEKGISGTPNTATLKIYNLKAENRLKIKKEFDKVRLEAGHIEAGNRGIIFEGFVRDVRHKREDTDITTTVECADGDKAYRQAVIAKTFPAGTKPPEMVDALLAEMPEVARGVIQGLDKLPAYPRAVTMVGAVRNELDKIGKTHRLYWSIQDGALEVIPGDGFVDDVVVISKESGMIGIPDITDNGIKVTTLLNPQLRIGRVIEVRSETLEMNDEQGRFRISGLGFSGDTHADDYFAEITGERIDGGKVVEE